jgi:hypothetical protein
MFREHCVHLGDAAAAEFCKLLADKLAALVPAERSAPLPPALQSWRTAEALLQDDRRFGALPRSGRQVSSFYQAPCCMLVTNLQSWKGTAGHGRPDLVTVETANQLQAAHCAYSGSLPEGCNMLPYDTSQLLALSPMVCTDRRGPAKLAAAALIANLVLVPKP